MPHQLAVGALQAIQIAHRAHGIDSALVNRGRGARADAGDVGGEADRRRLGPNEFPIVDVVAGDQLIRPALFLRHAPVADHREARPTRADRLAPHEFRRMGLPVAIERHLGQRCQPVGAEKLRPVVGRGVLQIGHRPRLGSLGRVGQQLVGPRAEAEGELGHDVAADPLDAEQEKRRGD